LTYILIVVARYELYYDLILGGKYTFKLIELHKQYGPIIRITPFELHISDPEFYDEVYASSASNRKRNKYPLFYESFGMDYSMFATIDHDLHKYRRAALNPFFSQQNVRKLQPVIQERVSTMLERIRDFKESEEVLNVSWLYAAFTSGKVWNPIPITAVINKAWMLSCNTHLPDPIIDLVRKVCPSIIFITTDKNQ
jgi:hypothetical protein